MLVINDLHVSYDKVKAVSGINLSASPGNVTLVLGANGAGKTTTLRAVAGLVPIESGEVILDGVRVTGMNPHNLVRRRIVLVPEGRRIFAPLTVEENLMMGGYTASREDLVQTLQNVYKMFPILFDRRDGTAGLLSGGEQQMLAFGRALMSQPRFIMMDEPSMGLAPTLVSQVLSTARRMADSGIGVLMVEQNVQAGLEVADTVVVVARGQVALSSSADSARKDPALLRAFLGETALIQ